MARDKGIKNSKNQFTSREIFLLILLGFAALIYAFANFILLPTLDEIAVLKTETATMNAELSTQLGVIAQKSALEERLQENLESTDVFKSKYFKTTNQEHFIKVLELQLLEDKLEVMSLSFNDAQNTAEFMTEEGQPSLLSSSIITFPFSGNYEDLMDLIRRVEQYDQMIRINALDIMYQEMPARAFSTSSSWFQSGYHENPIYQGNISLEFFTIAQEYESPYYSTLPDYHRAIEFNDSLFLYDDGGLGVPPFFVEKETEQPGSGTIVSGGDEAGGTGGTTGNTGTDGNTGTGGNGGGTAGENDDDETPVTDSDPATYIVMPGDTVFSISMKFYESQDPVEDIMALNNITDPNILQSGTILKLPYYGK